MKEMKDLEAEREIVATTISSCIGWFATKDFETLFNSVAQDPGFIEVHPTDKVIRGYEAFVKNAEIFKYEGFQYVRHELKDLVIQFSRSGDVAWFYCKLDDINTWDGQPANWENARWTGVLEKHDAKWVIVQQHFSFPSE